MNFNLNYYLLFIYRHDIYQYPKVEKNEIMSNNDDLSFTSAKAVLPLFMSPTGKNNEPSSGLLKQESNLWIRMWNPANR